MNRDFNNVRPGSAWSWRTVLCMGIYQLIVTCTLALLIVAAALPAQNLRTSPPNGRKVRSVGLAASAGSALTTHKQSPKVLPPRRSASPEGDVPNPPRISYEGGQLTIVAENSELSAILSLVRERTGAKIDLLPGLASERLWSVFGPGAARTVLAKLLNEMGLDYAIQGSDIDPQGIHRVLLHSRMTLDATRSVAEKENPTTREPEPFAKQDPMDLQPSSAEWQTSTETQESTAFESPTFTEAAPAEFQASPDAANSFGTKYSRLDIVIDPNSYNSIAEAQRVTVYVGQPVAVGETTTDVAGKESGGMLLRIWIGAKDKLPRMSREIFVGYPAQPLSLSELADKK